ncbi:MAG: hypothetical protein N4A35_04615 [Flavobacteriales bacterium]|jgi:hypothetical protein|nr:hypothetical protein [Flavobacteriales bacterium]
MLSSTERNIRIFVYRAIDEPDLCQQYLNGHRQVLIDYGIENITTNNEKWMNNPNVYCIVAKDMELNSLVGGTRIHIADGICELPVEAAVGDMDSKIHDKVRAYGVNGGVAESCGLWVAKNGAGLGISRYLMWASISSVSQLRISKLLGICASYTLTLFKEVGFEVDYGVGTKGNFPYPNDRYIANVIGVLNVKTIEKAAKNDKNIMLSLRNIPNQHRIEKNKNNICEIYYNLVYPFVQFISFKIE